MALIIDKVLSFVINNFMESAVKSVYNDRAEARKNVILEHSLKKNEKNST